MVRKSLGTTIMNKKFGRFHAWAYGLGMTSMALGAFGPDWGSMTSGGPAFTYKSGLTGALARSVDTLYGVPRGTAGAAGGEMAKAHLYKNFLPGSSTSRKLRRIDAGLDPDLNATGDLVLSMYQLRRRGF